MSKTVKTFIVLGTLLIIVSFTDLVFEKSAFFSIGIILLVIGIGIYFSKKSIDYFGDRKERKKEVKEQPKTLSEKYDVLKIYSGLAILLMIVVTGFYIYSLVQFSDLPKEMRKMLENGMITTTVSYFISMFSLYCLTKIIDFLFDLDNQDKISSEKE